jgi:MFS family permease
MLAASSANIFLQTTAPERLRGRIISFYVTTFVGFPPLGGFFIGNLAERFGTGKVLLWCALATAAASLLYLAVTGRKKVQPSGL